MIQQFENNPNLRFCKIKKGTKKPYERDWVNNTYSWEQIQQHINFEQNYGVVCGYGGLIVIDSDTEELRNYVTKELPTTFRVRTGSGGTHDYYICKELNKKIVLQREVHYGEIQSFGSQVVGAGSIHPNGNTYKVELDNPIIEISKVELLSKLKPFMKEVQVIENKSVDSLRDYGDSDINHIPILGVLKSDLKQGARGEFYGANPWHGSSTGMNFWVNSSKNVAFCFRCNVGVNVAQVIALNEGIIHTCHDRLSKEQFYKVLEIAYDKYNLKRPERKLQDEAMKAFTRESQAEQFCKIQPLFYDKTGLFWLWDLQDKYWKSVDDVEILNTINNSFKIDVISSKARNEILNSLKQIGRKNIPQSMSNDLIQFKNGLVQVRHPNELLEPSSSYFITNPIPWNIGKSDSTPIIDKIFKEWVGDEYAPLLYEILAYCMLPDYPLHRIFCLVGNGMNGKSCFLNLLRKLIGNNNITVTELDTLLTSRFEVTRLHKKLACIMGETNFVEMDKTSVLKKLSGGDLIGFEYKGKTPFEDRNYAKIIIATNNLPSTSDKTQGFYRRWIIIDFPNSFNEKKDILSEIPEDEYPNLIRKCVNILKDVLEKREFTLEGTIEERTKRFEDRSNPFDKFWQECVVEDSTKHITKRNFFETLNHWCKEKRFREISDVSIAKKVKEKGVFDRRVIMDFIDVPYGQSKPQMWVWDGIRWK